MGNNRWDYNPNTFKNIDTNNDGLLNSQELNNYFTKLYPDASTRATYENINNFIKNADLNGDGLISKGELALYKSGQDYLDQSTFVDKVATTTETDATKAATAKNTQWNNFKNEYNLYDSKDIISKQEIMDHDLDLNRNAISFRSDTFNSADANKDGFLDKSEMKTYLGNSYGTCSDKQINYTFENLDVNKDGLVSDGEFALFKLKNDPDITSEKLVNAGYSKSDADALVSKYATEGRSSFNANDVKNKDDILQDKARDNTKEDSMSVGGIIALVACCLVVVGVIAWAIYYLSKDHKKEKTETHDGNKVDKEKTETNEGNKIVSNNQSENSLTTINKSQEKSRG